MIGCFCCGTLETFFFGTAILSFFGWLGAKFMGTQINPNTTLHNQFFTDIFVDPATKEDPEYIKMFSVMHGFFDDKLALGHIFTSMLVASDNPTGLNFLSRVTAGDAGSTGMAIPWALVAMKCTAKETEDHIAIFAQYFNSRQVWEHTEVIDGVTYRLFAAEEDQNE